jgi:hypothetical protein
MLRQDHLTKIGERSCQVTVKHPSTPFRWWAAPSQAIFSPQLGPSSPINVTSVCRFCDEGTSDAIYRAVDAICAASTRWFENDSG